MQRRSLARSVARLAVVELRALLVADVTIGLARRRDLVRSCVILEPVAFRREVLENRLNWLIARRLGRNPDNGQIAPSVHLVLKLLDELQHK